MENKMENGKQATEPSREDKILEAVLQDDNLSGLFGEEAEKPAANDVVPEQDTTTDAAKEATEEVPAVNEVVEDEIDISDLLTPEGDVDLDKLKNERKSRLHAQKLIGKTAQQREEFNRLKSLEEKMNRIEAERAAQANVAQKPAETQKALSVDELNAKVIELYSKGRVVEANMLINEHDEKRRTLEAEVLRIRNEREAERANAEQIRRQAEEISFRKAHVNDGMFDASGNIKDRELFDKMVELVQHKDSRGLPTYATLPLEDLHAMAKLKLNRPQVNSAVDKTKARLVVQGKTNSRPVATATARQRAEIIPGVTDEDIEAVLGIQRK